MAGSESEMVWEGGKAVGGGSARENRDDGPVSVFGRVGERESDGMAMPSVPWLGAKGRG